MDVVGRVIFFWGEGGAFLEKGEIYEKGKPPKICIITERGKRKCTPLGGTTAKRAITRNE